MFTPRREHARFCSAGCRLVWYRGRTGDPIAGDSVLQWTVPAMTQAIRSLRMVDVRDRPAAYMAISDAVWAVTMVDAAMTRRHPGIYDEVLGGEAAPAQRLLEGSLAGLRFVRNRIPDQDAVVELVRPDLDREAPALTGVMSWQWQPAPMPVLTRRRSGAQDWEMARYEAYQSRLAGRPVGESFQHVEAFLLRTAAGAAVIADIGVTPAVPAAVGSRRA